MSRRLERVRKRTARATRIDPIDKQLRVIDGRRVAKKTSKSRQGSQSASKKRKKSSIPAITYWTKKTRPS